MKPGGRALGGEPAKHGKQGAQNLSGWGPAGNERARKRLVRFYSRVESDRKEDGYRRGNNAEISSPQGLKTYQLSLSPGPSAPAPFSPR